MEKRKIAAALLACSLLLAGCAKEEQPVEAPSPTPEHMEAPVILGESAAAEAARRLMAPYEQEIGKVSIRTYSNLTYAIPVNFFNQFIADAQAAGEQPRDGYYRFMWRQGGDYTYQTTVDDAPELETVTAAPGDETPMDNQLNGDYEVSGGGRFERARTYEITEDLTRGRAEISDTLNGAVTGHEYFSFCQRGEELYFVDATLNLTINSLGTTASEGYLMAVGVLRQDSLEILEYELKDTSQLPDPATLDWAQLIAHVTPVSRISAQGDQITVEP